MLAAASTDGPLARRVLASMKTDLATLTAAVDAEWTSRAAYLQDEPPTLLNASMHAVAEATGPGPQATADALLAAMLRYPESMASRIARRLNVDPDELSKLIRG